MEQAIKIKWQDLFKDIPGLKTEVMTNKVEIEREVIPIIFVPGIMGSRLKDNKGKKVWDPDAKVSFMLPTFATAGPFEKKYIVIGRQFDPERLQVHNDDADHNKDLIKIFKDAAERHWGGISWDSYGDVIRDLHNATWPEPVGHCFELPVHACGYNWSASNRLSGQKLAKYIKEVIQHYKGLGRICNQVILVTHSMGGLVGRSACKLWGADADVLGVVHGVQPVTGAPAAYWRMKAGFERTGSGFLGSVQGEISTWVLGSNGAEVTALLGNMPGGLQLLPNKDYTTNAGSKQWLTVKVNGAMTGLPAGNPYSEIYKEKTAFWRLITPEYLEPAEPPPMVTEGGYVVDLYNYEARTAQAAWGNFLEYIGEAESFHDALSLKKHPNTYNFYGAKFKTCDKVHYTYVKDDWRQWLGHLNPRANSGSFRTYENGEVIDIAGADGAGDGTVPESSGKALTPGTPEAKRWQKIDNVEHEPFYRQALAQAYTWVAITNMCRGKILKEVYGAPPDW